MVKIAHPKRQSPLKRCLYQVPLLIALVGLTLLMLSRKQLTTTTTTTDSTANVQPMAEPLTTATNQMKTANTSLYKCPYMSLNDLSEDERFPHANDRHMITPPQDEHNLKLVCCQTSQGPWNIVVHPSWAPRGADRFLAMVQDGYFSNQVPLMRCVSNFLCQFGLAGPNSRRYGATMEDDPPWLPQGPNFRSNENGVKRFAKGYLAYAGAGPNSRNNQFIVALTGSGPLGGGSPWEVPWGELVGTHSYETLDHIYTGYGENGPSQGQLHKREDYVAWVQKEYPKLDFIFSCAVVDDEN